MPSSSIARIAADLTSTDPVERNKIWVDVTHRDDRGVEYPERVLVDATNVPSYRTFQQELRSALNLKTGLQASIRTVAAGRAEAVAE